MKTPICDFIDGYIASGRVRMHMPGHKGCGEIEKYDITEIAGADALYTADGIIDESECCASELFGTAHSYYSAEGSTLAIKVMLAIASESHRQREKRPCVLAARNAHKAFINACALLDLDVKWMFSGDESHLCKCTLTPMGVEKALSSLSVPPFAVYITSPDYLGNILDIEGIAKVCKKANIPLLVDNAHGSYLKFTAPSLHPMDLGAAMCSDSAHKTLPVLTGGAYLHISKDYADFTSSARKYFSLFASTSPSYLILRSLDKANKYLSEDFSKDLSDIIASIDSVKERLIQLGLCIEETEKLKITVNARKMGYSGYDIDNILRENGIEVEFCDRDYLVLMPSVNTSRDELWRLVSVFSNIAPKESIEERSIPFERPVQVLSIRDAMLAKCKRIKASDAMNKICASPLVSCPPAIPIAVSGELIGEREIALFEHYGVEYVNVVDLEKNTF